jgi:hypothetical protein
MLNRHTDKQTDVDAPPGGEINLLLQVQVGLKDLLPKIGYGEGK